LKQSPSSDGTTLWPKAVWARRVILRPSGKDDVINAMTRAELVEAIRSGR
jgi:hypothetical protein